MKNKDIVEADELTGSHRKDLRHELMVRNSVLFVMLCFICFNTSADDFKDTFDGRHSSKWKCYGGQWVVKDKKYFSNSCDGYSISMNTRFPSFTYQADIALHGKGSAGIIFSVTEPCEGRDSLNGYYTAFNKEKGELSLYKVYRICDPGRVIPKGNRLDNHREEVVRVKVNKADSEVFRIKVVKEDRHIDVFLNRQHVISIVDGSFSNGYIGLKSDSCDASFDNIYVTQRASVSIRSYDWSWVKGAVYVPTNCVNQIQQWEEFDPVVNNRELYYARTYGFNMVRVYLHYLVWEKDKKKFLKDFEKFLQLAGRHGLKTEVIFFDDIWNRFPHPGPQEPPVPGVHNSRWVQCPGDQIKDEYDRYYTKLKAYVQDIVKAHKHDRRISFWEPYNEPGFSQEGKYVDLSKRLLNDSRIWIRETKTSIPMTSTAAPGFMGEAFSDFFSWHNYERGYGGPRGKDVLNTECMNRREQSVQGVVENYGKQNTGFIIWELGIGRDNCRFPWDNPENAPEVNFPFHGLIYPDGHPWDTAEVAAVRGDLYNMKLFDAEYYTGAFAHLRKKSFTPCIDFDLGDERGTGAPDASAGIDKDSFSIRWTGNVFFPAKGNYRFYVNTDNIAKVWIDDNLVIDKRNPLNEERSGNVSVAVQGRKRIKVEYVHHTGNASMHLLWQGPGIKKQVVIPYYR